MFEPILRRAPFFASLPEAAITDLARSLKAVNLPSGTLLFHEGDPGDGFYIVLEGQIEIIKSLGEPAEHIVAMRGPGDHIGEMSLLDPNGVRSAAAHARTPVRLIHFTRSQFDSLLHRYPDLGYQMARIMGDRLNQAHARSVRELEAQNAQLRAALAELQAAQAEILGKRALERELALARDIQMSILPDALPVVPGYAFGAALQPMSLVGGDFYDLIPLSGDSIGVAIGDVSGHGIAAALIMAVTVALLRAEACHLCSPAEVLLEVNAQLLKVNSAQMFVTLLYGVLDAVTGDFTFARAGHELPVHIRASGISSQVTGCPGRLLGLFEYPPLEDARLRLATGDSLLLVTDGVAEARNQAGDFFGDERILAEAAAAAPAGPQAICDRLLASVTEHGGPAPQDDITLLAVQRYG